MSKKIGLTLERVEYLMASDEGRDKLTVSAGFIKEADIIAEALNIKFQADPYLNCDDWKLTKEWPVNTYEETEKVREMVHDSYKKKAKQRCGCNGKPEGT